MKKPARPAVPITFLERLARPLLVRLIEPYADALSQRGFSVAALAAASADDRRPIRALTST